MNSSNILGGVIGSFEDSDIEMETSLVSSVFQGVEVVETGKFSSTGSIEFNQHQAKAQEEQKQKQEAYERRFYQVLKEEQMRTQQAKDRMWLEEEINDIATNMPTEEKNILLHYQANYKDRSIYQKAELRKKLIEQARLAEKQQKQVAIPSPAKQPHSLEVMFEGATGKQGNLSFQATG